MHYYQHNIADYRKDTGHLSLLEHGIYRQLLDTYYLDEKPIKTHLVIRRLSIKTEEEQTALKNVLDDFFTLSECGNFYNKKRCDKEISAYHAKANTARVNGSKGGRPKKPKKTQLVNLANPEKTGSKANSLTNKPLTNKPIKEREKELPKKSISPFLNSDAPIKPTVEQIKKHCDERENNINPHDFYDYHEAKGWKLGNSPIVDWLSILKRWERKEAQEKKDNIDDNDREWIKGVNIK